MLRLIVVLVLLGTPAMAEDFVPITIDAARYRQIDEAMAQVSMPRQAHVQWQLLWEQLERQAVLDKAKQTDKVK